jgi:transcriptional regulator with XRE-family HTH domain
MGLPALKIDQQQSPFMANPTKDGDRIRRMMRERGITQEALAEKLGLTQSMVSKLLNGKAPWVSTHWNKTAQLLGVSPRELHAPVTDEDKLVGGIIATAFDKGTRQRLEFAARRHGQTNEYGRPDLQAIVKLAVAEFLSKHEAAFQAGKKDLPPEDDE